MESIQDIITTGNAYIDSAIAIASAAGTWLVARLEWWRSQSNVIKVLTAVSLFLATAFMLSILTGTIS